MKKNELLFLFLVCLLAALSNVVYNYTDKNKPLILNNRPWMTIFVHGSFSTLLGLLSLPSVLNDQLSDTYYRQLNKKMREDSAFYEKQPILERGLIKVEPTFDLTFTNNKKLGAFPIIKAYDLVNQIVRPQEINLYYTFGWSGLVSQNRRRLEALRFYNYLTQELNALKQQGITPNIRIIAHSHGGNICINLAIIPLVLAQLNYLSTDDFYSQYPEACESFLHMKELIASMPEKEIAATHFGQKKADYKPCMPHFQIDELILLGTPIQVENQCFISSPLFKKVFSFYSEKDIIQELDWVSTKQGVSNQRIAPSILKHIQNNISHCADIIQTKLMYERPRSKANVKKNKPIQNKASTPSLLSKIFRSKKLQKDPDHKELWFFNWKNSSNKTHSFLNPLPSVILIPLITYGLELCSQEKDFDVNLSPYNKNIIAEIYKHKSSEHEVTVSMPLDLITQIKKNIAPWGPQNKKYNAELSKTYSLIE